MTHDVPVYWPAEAGFWLARAYSYFPDGSVHVAVVDPGVGTKRDIIAVVADGHAFLAPDNGLLAPIVAHRCPRPRSTASMPARRRPGSSCRRAERHLPWTRHFCAAGGGTRRPAGHARRTWGPRPHDIVPSWVDEPSVAADQVAGMVITTDHFGNLITNIDGGLIESFSRPMVTHRRP